jgi:hypothetical protein
MLTQKKYDAKPRRKQHKNTVQLRFGNWRPMPKDNDIMDKIVKDSLKKGVKDVQSVTRSHTRERKRPSIQ